MILKEKNPVSVIVERVRGPCSSLCRCRDKWELGQHCSSFILTYYKVIRTSKPAAAAKGSKKQNVNFQSNSSSSSHCVWELSTATIMYHLYHVLRMTVLKCIPRVGIKIRKSKMDLNIIPLSIGCRNNHWSQYFNQILI